MNKCIHCAARDIEIQRLLTALEFAREHLRTGYPCRARGEIERALDDELREEAKHAID
jgi:hypothetical protein